MTGVEIKKMIREAGLYCWQIADALNMQDSNFSRRLRKPFNDDEVKQIESIIESLKSQS